MILTDISVHSITEENFWRNYFYRVSLIIQAAELGTLGADGVGQASSGEDGKFIMVYCPSAITPMTKVQITIKRLHRSDKHAQVFDFLALSSSVTFSTKLSFSHLHTYKHSLLARSVN